MAYAQDKGKNGDYEVRDYLNDELASFGFDFERIGGAEKNRKAFAGDVCLVGDKADACLLYPYFIESKKQSHPRVFEDAEKARDDAKAAGKRGYILFTQKQAAGEKVGQNKLVVMDWSTFGAIIHELQGYRSNENGI